MENEILYKALKGARGQVVAEATSFSVTKDYMGVYNGINLSTPVSFIIKEVGRLCECYASDVFYDLKKLFTDLEGANTVLANQDSYQWVIGIREMGCDHDNFINARLSQGTDMVKEYRAIYELAVEPSEKYKGDFDLKVYRINRYTLSNDYKALCLQRS